MALILIVVLIIGGTQLYTYLRPEVVVDTSHFLAKIDSLERLREDSTEAIATKGVFTSAKFKFNPNQLSDSGYRALGISEKEIKTLRKYMATGAEFRIKTDFSKLYFISDSEYVALEPFIDLPDDYPKRDYKNKFASKYSGKDKPWTKKDTVKWSDTADTRGYVYKPFTCDLNFADTNTLKKLPYIGSFYAREIVRYREELGGIYELGQLLELYKMKPETIDIIADKVTIDRSVIRKLPINTATTQELAAHPYIDFPLATKIILKREASGTFKNMDQLCKTGLLNADLCRKLAPYLKF